MVFGSFFYGIINEIYTYLKVLSTIETQLNSTLFLFDYLHHSILYTVVSLVIYLAFYVLAGIGVYTLSKNNGVTTPYLAFVPFARFYQMGKLVGERKFFGMKGTVLGVVVAVLSAVYFVTTNFSDVKYLLEPLTQTVTKNYFIEAVISQSDYTIYNLLYYFDYAMQIVLLVFSIFLAIAVFRCYAGRNATLFSVLGVFFGIASVFIFVIRNNKKEEGLYARDYTNNQTQNHGNYNGYYGGFYDYGNGRNDDANMGSQSSKPADDVFEEYSDKKTDSDPFKEYRSDDNKYSSGYYDRSDDNSDDLFN